MLRRISLAWLTISLLTLALIFAIHGAWVESLPRVTSAHYNARFLAVAIALILGGCGCIAWVVARMTVIERQYQTIVESVADAIITANAHGYITYANPAALQMFGQERLTGRLLTVLMTREDQERHQQGIIRYLHTGKSQIAGRKQLVIGQRANGEEFPAALTVTILRAGAVFFLGVIHEMSEELAALREQVRQEVGAVDEQ